MNDGRLTEQDDYPDSGPRLWSDHGEDDQPEHYAATDTARRLLADGWPANLVAALDEAATYRMRLRTGEVMEFEAIDASRAPVWVRLWVVSIVRPESDDSLCNHVWANGLDVRVADIVWVGRAQS